MKPYCFVLMPFGTKTDESGRVVHFDSVYTELIKPAIDAAELEPIRADEEIFGGIIHKPMLERLMMCDYAIADLTTANANVFYELGIRHGVRPHSTVLLAGSGMRLPFDVKPLRAILYDLDDDGYPEGLEEAKQVLSDRLTECRSPTDDSPLYQLVSDVPRPDLQRLKTDTFRDLVEYSQAMKKRLSRARNEGVDSVVEIEKEINVLDADPAIVVDVYLSYRAVKSYQRMVDLANQMSPLLQQTVLVQEQLGFALNRLGRHEEAERVLLDLIDKYGDSSETNGILGRVYKDLWLKHKDQAGATARGYLDRAIETYVKGFEADWRDAYPGINAVTLMECKDPPDPRKDEIMPVVAYSARRRTSGRRQDYWDHATELELCVLSDDVDGAEERLSKALSTIRERWEPETTARNLQMLIDARASRGEECGWIESIVNELENAST